MTRNGLSRAAWCVLFALAVGTLVALPAHSCLLVDSPGKPCECDEPEGGDGGDGGPCGRPIVDVNHFTGDLVISDRPVTYDDGGADVPFVMYYSTQSSNDTALGQHWTSTYFPRIVVVPDLGITLYDGNAREPFFGLDGSGYLTVYGCSASHASGGGWSVHRGSHKTMSFNSSGQLTAVTTPQGQTSTFGYTGQQLTTVTDANTRDTDLVYVTYGDKQYLDTVTVPGGADAHFDYDTNNPRRLLTVTDAVDDVYAYGYAGTDTKITSITGPGGDRVNFTYETFNGKPAIHTITVDGRPETGIHFQRTVADGKRYVDVRQTKDGQYRTTRYVYGGDANDLATYGTLLQVIRDYGGLNLSETFQYNANHKMTQYRDSSQTETGGKEHVHRFYYGDTALPYRLTKYIDPENYSAGQGENSPGYLFEYDNNQHTGFGNLTKITVPATPENRVTDISYVADTRRVSSITVQDRDINGNSTPHTTEFSYYDENTGYLPYSVTDARNNTTYLYYDTNWYLDYIDPPLGGNINVTANGLGDITAVTDGNGNTTSFQYDGLHRPTRVTYPSVGAGQKYVDLDWQCCGLSTITDENGRVTRFDYDPDTQWLTKVHEDYAGLNYTTEYGYDEVGNVETVKNARGYTTTYTYDDADRLTRVDYPDSTYETWTLRDDGRVYTHTDGRGRQTTYRYDADDRLAGSGSYFAITYPNNTDVKITRDKDGLVTTVNGSTGTSTAVYYPSGWLKTLTDGYGKTVTYEYNGVGAVSTMKTPDNLSFTYGYNALNLLTSVANPNSVTTSFSYDNGGRLTGITRPGSYIQYEYNARDWLTAVLNRATGGATRYDARYYYQDGTLWDHTGNPLKRTEDWGSGLYTTTLRYDNVYRLTEETKRDSGGATVYTLMYAYDAVGNRLVLNPGGSPPYLGYTYDANDKLINTRSVGGGPPGPITANMYYDGAGNLTSVTGSRFGSWTMAYDDESRLTSVTSPAGSESFVYNALGQRMQLTVGGVVTKCVYDGDRVLEERDSAGTVLARYTTAGGSYYAPLLHMWRASGSVSRMPMYDLTGSVRGLLDASGNVTDTYTLDAFGKQLASTGSTVNPYRFGGAWGYINGASGLQQLGARFYWPEIGRFIQQDPIGDGMNWYAYVGNNPVVWADPTGLHITTSTLHNMVHGDDCTRAAYGQGAKAWVDGMIPWWDPFKGQYDPNDQALQASKTMGGVTRDAMLIAYGASTAASHPLPPKVTRPTGVPRRLAGRLHQDQVKIPHLNIGGWHVVVNRYNWYKPWKWFVK